MPGGADLGYCRALNGPGNKIISQFVWNGGSYLGLCAGGYYGCGRVEFEVKNEEMEVVGSRELSFFPGVCRGAAFSGFTYASENGAKASNLKIEKSTLNDVAPEEFRSYYNGGGLFVDAEKYEGIEVLARYTQDLSVIGGDAAVVYCKVGNGRAILTGPHPEFAGINLDKNAGPEGYECLVDAIVADQDKRIAFLKACLLKLGLNISEENAVAPALSRLHLSSIYPTDVGQLVERLKDIITIAEDDTKRIIGENDTFILENRGESLSLNSLLDVLDNNNESSEDKIIDYNKIEKRIQIHDRGSPLLKETPYFNHDTYFQHLKEYRLFSRSSPEQFGSFLLYGETVTSTNTILEKNFKLLQKFPNGLTAVATLQIAGRGRGNNVWVTPMGALVWSTVVRHPSQLESQAPVVFMQYLAALAIVEAIKNYGADYADMPVRLKWPNDIYAETPSKDGKGDNAEKQFVKIGGILVNCNYVDSQFLLVVGCGINTTNRAPTTSLNLIVEALNVHRKAKGLTTLSWFKQEKLLAKILVTFEEMYYQFCNQGFKPFEELYYKHWLHSGQIVRLEMEGGVKARIRGITMEGLLKADELDEEDILTGRVFTLYTDSNSFDFLKGLLKKKI
ncbi:biotin holocarboxylase synthetase [Maublancomyces gigas]|uniref:Biotin holocarboxylase synthetase n=1 Tax=Discina gigas TaxID=1032678 RepID=A0ABR3GGJ9_9PEZI